MLNIFNYERMSKSKKSSEAKMVEDDERPEWNWIKKNSLDLE